MKNTSNNSKGLLLIAVFGVGAVAGAIATALMTPHNGITMRAKLKDRANKAQNKLKLAAKKAKGVADKAAK